MTYSWIFLRNTTNCSGQRGGLLNISGSFIHLGARKLYFIFYSGEMTSFKYMTDPIAKTQKLGQDLISAVYSRSAIDSIDFVSLCCLKMLADPLKAF